LALHDRAALEALVTVAAETRQDLNAVQGRHQAALDPPLIEGFAAFQTAIDVH
jgi:hypothetical protein